MIRKISLTLLGSIFLYTFGMQTSSSADQEFKLSDSEIANMQSPRAEAPSVEVPNSKTIQNALSIVVKPSTAQGKDGKLRFTVELVNRAESVITWKSGTNPPFDIRAYTPNGERLGPPRPEKVEVLEQRGGTKDPVFEIMLKPLEKKIYTVEYPGGERLAGTYKVSVAMPLFKYTVDGKNFVLKNVALVHSNELPILVESEAPAVQDTAGQPLSSQTLLPREVASVVPSTLSWSLGQDAQPKVVSITLNGVAKHSLMLSNEQSRFFTTKVLRGTGEGVYEVIVTPTSTRDATSTVLQLRDGAVPLDIDVNVGKPQAAVPSIKLGAPGTVTEPVEATRLPKVVLQVNQAAPEFSLNDMNGQKQILSAFRGKKNVLLTFFPKCFTGGCANHLSSLRDVYNQLEAADVQVLAVSVDPADGEKGQRAFAKQWALPFPLIPDVERKLSLLYGAVQQPTDLDQRMTVIIDKQGIIRYMDTNVHVMTHGADMLAKIRELGLIQ